ncbi:hypothetical protein roselon_02482 [Roseibacterium elongatum DSM 19469]|uniref:LCCL domain-containing protein n=1 Tax=Roseicyclus elongatus DSM 19469 TaxID=1294273 RepID=W8RU97_9RHOB|nr:LCCL domain-containing protein [Roseibacterium elongatum]AHM04803.1 hypothetical protein roselon_02482 [Roseibacterium elongatum DSM 19469]
MTGAAHVLYGVLLGGAEGVYSFNSTLAMAAVQAGVLGNGQSGQVRVEILPGPGLFRGTTRYGVTSGDSDQSGIGHLAFRFVEAR